ncbi:MAG: DUF131 domain-containing protein [Nitrososphaerota archaeon]|nr:DUF131 domain-containing protein [Nitrososphaerota archaeon]MDG7013847.1 DUF131 domain-containing protein [Nitrososphaerota archaeon]MDG7025190.1 DUF131 domain-containing protein [Nitrososphaerota archaeon]
MRGALLAAGLLMVAVGFGMVFAATLGDGSTSVGGAVFIGPFPIVFGSGSDGWPLALGSLLVGAVMVGLILIWGYHFAAKGEE